MVVDPEAAQTCLRAGAGKETDAGTGHRVDPVWGSPLKVMAKVLRTSDGRFQYRGGILGGTWASMGPSATLQVGSIQILVASYPTYDWADEQYRCMGMNPAEAKFVGVKNMMNFRLGYRDVMKGVLHSGLARAHAARHEDAALPTPEAAPVSLGTGDPPRRRCAFTLAAHILLPKYPFHKYDDVCWERDGDQIEARRSSSGLASISHTGSLRRHLCRDTRVKRRKGRLDKALRPRPPQAYSYSTSRRPTKHNAVQTDHFFTSLR